MPAPKSPNTAAATAKVRRKGQETQAAKLRAAGWVCVPRETAEEMLSMDAEGLYHYLHAYVEQFRPAGGVTP